MFIQFVIGFPAALSGLPKATCRGLGLAVCLASPALGQRVLWEHVGDGVRTTRPPDFGVIGDLTGDGLQEVLIPGKSNTQVQPGDGGHPLTTHEYLRYNHGNGVGIGGGYADLGDLTGDGVPEYSAAATNYSTATAPNAGLVLIYDGATHKVRDSIFAGIAGARFGRAVIPLGDINGDGHLDIGVRSQYWWVRIYAGPDWTFLREEEAYRVCGLGDIDGDGIDDYATSNAAYGIAHGGTINGQGRVLVQSGVDGAILTEDLGTVEFGILGADIQSAGDWDGDGLNDIVAGAPGALHAAPSAVYVLSSVTGLAISKIDPSGIVARESEFGATLGSGFDVNGDGFPDVLVGARFDEYDHPAFNDDSRYGSTLVYSGATGALLWYERGEHPAEEQGLKVQLIEDFNGDGLADWATLSPDYDASPWVPDNVLEGRVTIYSGAVGDAVSHCAAGTNSIGKEARLWNTGPVSVKQNRFELGISDLPPQQTAILIHGQLAPANPFGAGELCIGAPVDVLDVVTSPAVGNLARSHTLDLKSAPFTNGGNEVRAGDRWAFQALYRDGSVQNTSNALEVTFLP